MSLSKCRKYLRETAKFDVDLPPMSPIFLSDSKASYLQSQVTFEIENEIVWWYNTDWDSYTAAEDVRLNIDEAIRYYGPIHLYVWVSTCNFTLKTVLQTLGQVTYVYVCLSTLFGYTELIN